MKPLDDGQIILETLREAVREALERKRLLGQYAVVWRDGRAQFIGPNPPADTHRYVSQPPRLAAGVREPDCK